MKMRQQRKIRKQHRKIMKEWKRFDKSRSFRVKHVHRTCGKNPHRAVIEARNKIYISIKIT